MSEPDLMEPKDLVEFLEGDWARTFEAGIRAAGRRLARAGQVAEVRARVLDAGDLELTGVVTGKMGSSVTPNSRCGKRRRLSGWMPTARCGSRSPAASTRSAVLENLLQALLRARVARAFGEALPTPSDMTAGRKILRLAEPPAAAGE